MKKKATKRKQGNKEAAKRYRERAKARFQKLQAENTALRLENQNLQNKLQELKAADAEFLSRQWNDFFSTANLDSDSETLWDHSVPEADSAGAPSEVDPETSSATSSATPSDTESEAPSEAYSEVPSPGDSETASESSGIAAGFFRPIPEPVSPLPLAVQPGFQLNKSST